MPVYLRYTALIAVLMERDMRFRFLPMPAIGIRPAWERTKVRWRQVALSQTAPCERCGTMDADVAGACVDPGCPVRPVADSAAGQSQNAVDQGVARADAVRKHRSAGRSIMLLVFASMTIGTLLAIATKSAFTMMIVVLFPFMLGSPALLEFYRAWYLETGQEGPAWSAFVRDQLASWAAYRGAPPRQRENKDGF